MRVTRAVMAGLGIAVVVEMTVEEDLKARAWHSSTSASHSRRGRSM